MTEPRPYSNTREDPTFEFMGAPTLLRATRDSTRGAYGLVEQWMPFGFTSPYHRHELEDEAFYVLEGELAVVCDGAWSAAGPGTYVFGPRGLAHGFEVTSRGGARMLLLASPGGFEAFVHEMRDPQRSPDAAPAAPDMEKMAAAAARYRVDILGPLPERPVATTAPGSGEAADDIARIDALRRAHVAALESGNAGAWAGIFAQDALQMPPNAPGNAGRGSIRAWCEGFLGAFRVRFSLSVGELRIAGGHAIETGSYSIEATPTAGGPARVDEGKYITVYRREESEGWRVWRDIWNSDRAMPNS